MEKYMTIKSIRTFEQRIRLKNPITLTFYETEQSDIYYMEWAEMGLKLKGKEQELQTAIIEFLVDIYNKHFLMNYIHSNRFIQKRIEDMFECE